jgi:hypothetical protein
MEVTFRNKRADFQAYYDYMVRETEQGKKVSKQIFQNWLIWAFLVSALFGSLAWALSGKGQTGLIVTFVFFLFGITIRLLVSKFKPVYHAGIQVYRRQESSITPNELKVFELPRTIATDDNWLEIRSSEAIHRWRWRQVDHIGLTSDFIFIHVGSCPVVYVPKRDFTSEQGFKEFGTKLVELKERYKNQPIGAE